MCFGSNGVGLGTNICHPTIAVGPGAGRQNREGNLLLGSYSRQEPSQGGRKITNCLTNKKSAKLVPDQPGNSRRPGGWINLS